MMFKRLLSYFIQGVVLIVPVAATLYLMYKILQIIDGILDLDVPGLGILVLLVFLTVLGFLGNTIIAQPIKMYLKRLLKRAPLINTVYSAIRDLISALIGKKKTFSKPVLVKVSKEADLEKLGFITQESLTQIGLEEGKVAVYLPHSYNFSGNLFIVPSSHVTPLDIPASEAMKFIVSGGVTSIIHKGDSSSNKN